MKSYISKIGIFLFFLIFNSAFASSPVYTTFSDVPSDYIYNDALGYVKDNGIALGYPNGSFKPDNTINRAEFTKIIIGAKYGMAAIDDCIKENIKDSWEYVYFPDVNKNSWFAKYICVAKLNNIIDGYSDGNFKPTNNINFSEASKIIVNTFGYSVTTDEVWYKPFIDKLAENMAIPTSIDDFSKNITRGEMAEMIYRLINNITSKPTNTYENIKNKQNNFSNILTEDQIKIKNYIDGELKDNLDSNGYLGSLKGAIDRYNTYYANGKDVSLEDAAKLANKDLYNPLELQLSDKEWVTKINMEGSLLIGRSFDESLKVYEYTETPDSLTKEQIVKLIDKKYQPILENDQKRLTYKTTYTDVGVFIDGIARAEDKDGNELYIDLSGKQLFNQRFKIAYEFDNSGIAVVKDLNDNMFHINNKGDRLYKENFKTVSVFDNGRSAVTDFQDRMYHIDLSGKKIYIWTFKSVSRFGELTANATDFAGKNYSINLNGTIRDPLHLMQDPVTTKEDGDKLSLIAKKYPDYNYYSDNTVTVRDANKNYFHIDLNDNRLYQNSFSWVQPFSEGFAGVQDKDGNMFHINKKGERIYTQNYAKVWPYYNGVAKVNDKDGKEFYIDTTGNWVMGNM